MEIKLIGFSEEAWNVYSDAVEVEQAIFGRVNDLIDEIRNNGGPNTKDYYDEDRDEYQRSFENGHSIIYRLSHEKVSIEKII